jgi:hypothetical protein
MSHLSAALVIESRFNSYLVVDFRCAYKMFDEILERVFYGLFVCLAGTSTKAVFYLTLSLIKEQVHDLNLKP